MTNADILDALHRDVAAAKEPCSAYCRELEEEDERDGVPEPFVCEKRRRARARLAAIPGAKLLEVAIEVQMLVDAQAENEGLWFMAKTAPEAYLQQELRKLHAKVEAGHAAIADGGKALGL